MVLYAGLVLLCCLGFAAAGEKPLGPNQFQTQPQWENEHGVTTVCIQVRGPYGQALCGPVVSKPDNGDQGAGRNAGLSDPQGLIQPDQFRSAQGDNWAGAQLNPSIPLRSAVLEGFIGNGPVYQMSPGKAMETLPPLVKFNSFAPPHPMAMVRAPQQSPGPFMDHAVRLNGVPPQVMLAPPPEMAPHFQNSGPQLRTFPFAPFGIEQPAGPQQQFQMNQALGARASNPQFMPAMRSADCPENFQQPGSGQMMRASQMEQMVPNPAEKPQDVKELSKQCEQQEQELKNKKEEISELKKQLEKMSHSAKAASSTTIEQKTITTKSSQSMDKDTEEIKQKVDGLKKKK